MVNDDGNDDWVDRPNKHRAFDLRSKPGFLFRVLEQKSNALFLTVAEGHNLTARQFGVLAILDSHRPMTQSDLGVLIQADKSTLGEMIRRMGDRGLLLRSKGRDRRSVILSISEDGRALFRELLSAAEASQAAILGALPSEYRPIFMKCLQLLADSDFDLDLANTSPAQRKKSVDNPDVTE